MKNLKTLTSKVIPYLCENFITIPLWEEGNFTPQVNFWQSYSSLKIHEPNNKLIVKIFKEKHYVIEFVRTSRDLYAISIIPNITYLKAGGFRYKNENWSVEEIIELFSEYLINKSKII